MGTFKGLHEMDAWLKARELVREIYAVSNQELFKKDFALRDQIRRAAVSILSNIAEGYDQDGNAEFMHFLSIAKGSAGELKSQLHIALDQNYLSKPAFERLHGLVLRVGSLIAGLMNYLRQSKITGIKFK
jgi:four helix bundle protein